MAGYERQIANAKKMIAKKGQSVTWRVSALIDDETTVKPWRPQPAANEGKPAIIVFFPLDKETKRTMYDNGVGDLTGYEMGYMGAVDFAPNKHDTIVRNNVSLSIESIDCLAPNGDPILYTIIFKGVANA